jgi:predicted nucleic acid-binding protein
MARTFLADSWFFIANIDRSDDHHLRARRLYESKLGDVIITHDSILTEVLAFFSAEGAAMRAAAARFVRQILRDFRVVSPDRALFIRALELYERRLDKQYSLVDCMSMLVMRDRGITTVLTNDHHFSQEGFTLLNT